MGCWYEGTAHAVLKSDAPVNKICDEFSTYHANEITRPPGRVKVDGGVEIILEWHGYYSNTGASDLDEFIESEVAPHLAEGQVVRAETKYNDESETTYYGPEPHVCIAESAACRNELLRSCSTLTLPDLHIVAAAILERIKEINDEGLQADN